VAVNLLVKTVQLSTDGLNTRGPAQSLAGSAGALTVNLSDSNVNAGTVPASATILPGSSVATAAFTPVTAGNSTTISVVQPNGWYAPQFPLTTYKETSLNISVN
jgi:hypothetical protein